MARVCSRIKRVELTDLGVLSKKKRVIQNAKCIMKQQDNVMSREFTLMPSERRYNTPLRKINLYSSYFILSVIRLMNANFNE